MGNKGIIPLLFLPNLGKKRGYLKSFKTVFLNLFRNLMILIFKIYQNLKTSLG